MLSSRPRERSEQVEGSIRLAKLAQDKPMGKIRVGGRLAICVHLRDLRFLRGPAVFAPLRFIGGGTGHWLLGGRMAFARESAHQSAGLPASSRPMWRAFSSSSASCFAGLAALSVWTIFPTYCMSSPPTMPPSQRIVRLYIPVSGCPWEVTSANFLPAGRVDL